MTDSQIAKYEGKLELSGELGEMWQESATAAKREASERKGGSEALSATGKQINQQLVALLDKEWKDGEFDDCDSPETALAKVKRYISRAVGFCENLSAMAKNAELVASGKVLALQLAADMAGKHNDAAAARIRQLNTPPEPFDPDNPQLDGKGNHRRRPGERPVAVSKAKKGTTKKSSKKKSGKKASKKVSSKKK